MRTFAYVANYSSGDISIYQVDPNGSLVSAGTAAAGGTVHSVAIHPSGRFAYASRETDRIDHFTIDPETGMLSPTGTVTNVGEPGEVRFHPSGKFAYVIDFRSRSVLIYTVRADTGDLDPSGSLVFDPIFVQSLGIDPSGSFVYVTTSDDRVSSYTVDLSDGHLEVHSSATAPSPSAVTVAPSGSFLLVSSGNTISSHAVDANGGMGAAVSVDADNLGSIAIDKSGRFAYAVVNHGLGYFLSAFTINAMGEPTFAVETSLPGALPYSLALTPSGQHLYATNQIGDAVLAFRVDQDTLALDELTPPAITGREPAGITVVSITQ